jgi:delta24-sterol reductase
MNPITSPSFTAPSEEAVGRHQAKLARVVDAVVLRPSGKRISVRKDSVSHTIKDVSWKDKCHRVDVSELNEILGYVEDVDRDGKRVMAAVCEGQVQMGQLAEATLPHNHVARVVPDDLTFTVSGLINGEGIQTSAHRYGVFTTNVLEFECVLGNGQVITARFDNEYRDLFVGVLGESYGSIAIVTKAVVALRPCQPYVVSHYHHFDQLDAFVAAIDSKTRSQASDFLEGLMLSPTSFLITESYFSASTMDLPQFFPSPTDNSSGNPYYYQYLQQSVLRREKTGEVSVAIPRDVISTFDFLFRSKRGAWWMMECHVGWPWLCRQRWFRKYVDKLAAKQMQSDHTIMTVGHLSVDEMHRCIVLQDMGMRLKRLKEGLQWNIDNLGVYPTWVCPAHDKTVHDRIARSKNPRVPVGDLENEWFADIGFYGEPTVRPFYHRQAVRRLQHFVDYPSKWGVSYLDKADVQQELASLRARYHATEAFVPLEEKVTFRDGDKDAQSTETMIPAWRLYRDHGKYWKLKLAAAVGGLMTVSGFAAQWAIA